MPRLNGGWRPGDEITVTRALEEATSRAGDDIFLDFSGRVLSYADVFIASASLAHGLAELGVQRGDTVAWMLDNSPDAVITWFAINQLGAISVPMNTAYKGEFLRHQLSDCGTRVLIAEAEYVQRLGQIDGALPTDLVLYRGDVPPPLPNIRARPLSDVPIPSETPPADDNRSGDLACLMYTAGTTGPSKGCMISHGFLCSLARQSLRNSRRAQDELFWTPLPLYHINASATTVVATMLLGGSASIAPRFSLSGFWPEIERTGARIAALLGSLIVLVASAPDTDASKRCYGQLRVVTGAPFPAPLQQVWRERFGIEQAGSNAYGMTEAAVLTGVPPGEEPKPGKAGKINEEFDVRIVDDNDQEVPPGQVGEIVCRPLKPHVMFDGYWRNPQATIDSMRNMWFHTGDLGVVDLEGWLRFVDRKNDYLRRSGENISSFEMETQFLAHPSLKEVAVHAVASELSEDEVKVTAVLLDGATLTEEELCLWSIDRLPYYAVPRFIEFRGELPKNDVGRVLKRVLREEGRTPGTWDRVESEIQLKKR